MDMSIPVTISVHPERCKRDGLCAKVCPARIFRHQSKERPTVERAEECVLCGQCLAVCPSGAIVHSRLLQEGQREIGDAPRVGADVMGGFLRTRRSVRVYRDQLVPRELLADVADAAGFAPTGAFGGAGWVRTVTVVTGKESMQAVREATVGYMRKLERVLSGLMVGLVSRFSEEARAGRATLPDLRMRLAEWDAGRDAVTYDAQAALFVSAAYDTATPHEDCDGALMNMMLAAHAHGLGTCWNGWLGNAATSAHVSGPRALGALLGLPANHRVCEAMTVGWPAIALRRIPQRITAIRWVDGNGQMS
jgi:ferredoxin